MPEATAFDDVLDSRLVNDGQHLFGLGFRRRQARAKPAAGITALRTLCMPRGLSYMGARPRIRPIVCPSARVEFDDQLNLYGTAISRSGRRMRRPLLASTSRSRYGGTSALDSRAALTMSRLRLFSRSATVSPGLTWWEGMSTFLPFKVTWPWVTSCRA